MSDQQLTSLEHSLLLRLADQDTALQTVLQTVLKTVADLETKLMVITQRSQEWEKRALVAESVLQAEGSIIPESDTNG